MILSHLKKMYLCSVVLFLLVWLKTILSIYGIKGLFHWYDSRRKTFSLSQNLSWSIKSVLIASKIIPRCSCLVKAVALKLICNPKLDLILVIGIAKTPEFQSHAWVERNNNIIFGYAENQQDFKPIFSLI